jgi:hypothetical protein
MLNSSTYITVYNQFALTDDQCKLQFKYQTIKRHCICMRLQNRSNQSTYLSKLLLCFVVARVFRLSIQKCVMRSAFDIYVLIVITHCSVFSNVQFLECYIRNFLYWRCPSPNPRKTGS